MSRRIDLADWGLRAQTEDEARRHLIVLLQLRCRCGRPAARRTR